MAVGWSSLRQPPEIPGDTSKVDNVIRLQIWPLGWVLHWLAERTPSNGQTLPDLTYVESLLPTVD